MQRPAGLSAAGMSRFAVVALGFAFGLWFVLTSPYRHAALWQAWAPAPGRTHDHRRGDLTLRA